MLKKTFCIALVTTTALLCGNVRAAETPKPTAKYYRAPNSKAPFSPAVRAGDTLYVSGQLGMTPEGKLPPDFEGQAKQAMANLKSALESADSSLDEVVKCTVMLADMSRWQDFNKIYITYFKPERLPARSAFGATALANGAMMEVECLAYSPRG